VRWLREELPLYLSRRTVAIGAAALAAIALLVWALSGPLSGGGGGGETRVVTVSVSSDNPAQAPVGPLGFPLVATRNTTRIGGADPVADAAAAAIATHPPAPAAKPVEAVVLVGEGDWQAGIAASVLAGPPLRVPILIGGPGELPPTTTEALAELKPTGGAGPGGPAVYAIGQAPAAPGFKTAGLVGSSPAELASSIDALRGKLSGEEPRHVVIASLDNPAFAMPAAAWAARSGDPVLFSGRDEVPKATLEALKRHRDAQVYVLGGPKVISDKAVRTLERVSAGIRRVGDDEPVANAIAFARYTDGSFGWNINDPGHGLILANDARTLDAAAAASLASSGTWGPLLLTDEAGALPPELKSFLLDIKPGYEDDPTRAVYNHIWIMGDSSAIGAAVQAQIDDLAELAEIGAGTGGPVTESGGSSFATPGGADAEVKPGGEKKGGK
jgi:hypothetical protein